MVEVTKEDREAAALISGPIDERPIRHGRHDESRIVQTFARHREEARIAALRENMEVLKAIRDWQLWDENRNPNVPADFRGSAFDYLKKLANDAIRKSHSAILALSGEKQ